MRHKGSQEEVMFVLWDPQKNAQIAYRTPSARISGDQKLKPSYHAMYGQNLTEAANKVRKMIGSMHITNRYRS